MKRLALLAFALICAMSPASAKSFDYTPPAQSTAVASGTADAQAVAAAANLKLVGFSCRENAGTPGTAEFIIRNGTTTSDPAVAFVKLAASESVRDFFGEQGIACPDGIFIDRVSGTSEIAVYTKR